MAQPLNTVVNVDFLNIGPSNDWWS